MGAIATFTIISAAHLPELNIVYRITKIRRMVIGSTRSKSFLRSLLALIFSGPVNVVSSGQRHLLVHLVDGLLDRASQITTAHAVLNGDVALLSFAVNLLGAVGW